MFLEKIKIENFKAISALELALKPGVNLLIGDNGVGKTSVLDAIVIALGGYLNGVNGVYTKSILSSDIRMETLNVGSASTSIKYHTPVKISCELNVDDQIFKWERIREDELPRRKTKIVKIQDDITKYAQMITNDISQELPVLSYQSSVRASQTRRENFGAEMKKNMGDRRCGYLGCLDAVLDLRRIKEWCYEMQRTAFEQNRRIEEYEQFKKIVGTVMQQMSELKELPQVYYSRQHKDIVYLEGEEVLPISYLSAGYQSVLWMVMDLAYRLATLNPGKSDLMECKGVVLIDEVDMHLHPKWQWNVVKTLKETFPNIQFIIATHSPIIISSCKAGNLILIDNKQEVSYLKDAYGYSVNDVLALCQGSSDVSKKMKMLSEEFDMAISESDFDKAGQIVDTMTEEYGIDNTEVIKAKTELDMEKSFGEES